MLVPATSRVNRTNSRKLYTKDAESSCYSCKLTRNLNTILPVNLTTETKCEWWQGRRVECWDVEITAPSTTYIHLQGRIDKGSPRCAVLWGTRHTLCTRFSGVGRFAYTTGFPQHAPIGQYYFFTDQVSLSTHATSCHRTELWFIDFKIVPDIHPVADSAVTELSAFTYVIIFQNLRTWRLLAALESPFHYSSANPMLKQHFETMLC